MILGSHKLKMQNRFFNPEDLNDISMGDIYNNGNRNNAHNSLSLEDTPP